MPAREWSRRDVLREWLLGGLLVVPARWSEAEALAGWFGQGREALPPTPHVETGPFYKKRAPATTMLRASGDRGVSLAVSGTVVTTNGEPVPAARIEFWQANDAGLYDLEGYRYRALLTAS